MKRATKPLGDAGDELAAARLAALGYRVLDRNFRCSLGELDCVAVKDRNLVFLEVKTRRSADYGGPLEAVDLRKRRKLTRLAHWYVAEKRLHGVPHRFDVLAVWLEGGAPRVEVIENAFEAEEWVPGAGASKGWEEQAGGTPRVEPGALKVGRGPRRRTLAHAPLSDEGAIVRDRPAEPGARPRLLPSTQPAEPQASLTRFP